MVDKELKHPDHANEPESHDLSTSERLANIKDPEAKKQIVSSLRLRTFMKLWELFAIKGKIGLEGEGNLDKIPDGKRCIVACTHISDGDVPVAFNALGKKFDLAIANQSTHHSFKEEAPMRIGLAIAGKSNFLPIDFRWDKSVGRAGKRGSFNPDNFLAMKTALEEKGKTVLMAAHNPTFGEMPSKGGIGMVYLAQITNDSVIVPVACDLQQSEGHVVAADSVVKSLIKRPNAKVIVGEPIELPKIPDIELVDKKKKGTLLPEEIPRLKIVMQQLKQQSDFVMQAIAGLLPENKRGSKYK